MFYSNARESVVFGFFVSACTVSVIGYQYKSTAVCNLPACRILAKQEIFLF